MIQHLSIRVPWHDGGWRGCVCARPERNHACRALNRIAADKDDACEMEIAGRLLEPCSETYQPPCLLENGAFMSPRTLRSLPVHHPYSPSGKWEGYEFFRHIRDTDIEVPPHTLIARPYRWLLRGNASNFMNGLGDEAHFLDYDDSIESGSPSWVSNGINQKKIFDYFYRDVRCGESLVVVYAKAVPFVEAPGRVVVGFGGVTSLGEIREYSYAGSELREGENSACLWECFLGHDIREEGENSFLFPFEEIQQYVQSHPRQRVEELVVLVPDACTGEFSYAAEHLSCDTLILVLRRAVQVLEKYEELGLFRGRAERAAAWCRARLKEVWRNRGVYPGLAAVLTALGLPFAGDVVRELRRQMDDARLWNSLPDVLGNLKRHLPEESRELLRQCSAMKCRVTAAALRNKERLAALLARMNISVTQARMLLRPEDIRITNLEYLMDMEPSLLADRAVDNPYLLYEKTRRLPENYRFGMEMIDLAMFPHASVGDAFMEDYDDERRLRAMFTALLEQQAEAGHTLASAQTLLRGLAAFRSEEAGLGGVEIGNEVFMVCRDFFADEFEPTAFGDNPQGALQLCRLKRMDDIIRKFFRERLSRASLNVEEDWDAQLDAQLGSIPSDMKEAALEKELAARGEKKRAVEIMAASPVCVLTGGAGTGKTTTIAALCMNRDIQQGGILLLAPTGKARVVLERKLREKNIPCKAYTLFQYLLRSHHCDFETMTCYLSGRTDGNAFDTVIIDECSMLTEEMLAAFVEAAAAARRVILVGDPNQLPPIGAGKPFCELVRHLERHHPDRLATLHVGNRQQGVGLDREFAGLFTADRRQYVGDDIMDRLARDTEHIEIVPFSDEQSLQAALCETVARAAKMRDTEDVYGFERSLGGQSNGTWVNFPPSAAKAVDNWQILSPFRNDAQSGTQTVNRLLQQRFGSARKPAGDVPGRRTTRHPLGPDGILFGEKVINIRNQKMEGYPREGCLDYVANGETGIVERLWEKPANKRNTHQVRFSSQPEFCYNWPSQVGEESCDLELAYALTVHKAQGSGFGNCILILDEPSDGTRTLVSRELIYTALTRHADKVWILYNKAAGEIRKYAQESASELARRFSNLFATPSPCDIAGELFDADLIHRTHNGEWVRSKSEVIIANELAHAGIDYAYEKPLELPDGSRWLPDFTIMRNGEPVYWEHLGLLDDPAYKRRWEAKKAAYARNGISEEKGNLVITSDVRGSIDCGAQSDIAEAVHYFCNA